MLQATNIKKAFQNGEQEVLRGVDFHVEKGSWVSIMGPSGTGKTTLINCLSGLLPPDEGGVSIADKQLYQLSERELSDFRRKEIGFIFQDYKLLPHYSVIDNVMLPLYYDEDREQLKEKAKENLEQVGIDEHLYNRLPGQLSGGEKQRVAIARSLIGNPQLLFCDEPTGNFDIDNRDHIIDLLEELNRNGQTIIVVTHDQDVADPSDFCYQLDEGVLKVENKVT